MSSHDDTDLHELLAELMVDLDGPEALARVLLVRGRLSDSPEADGLLQVLRDEVLLDAALHPGAHVLRVLQDELDAPEEALDLDPVGLAGSIQQLLDDWGLRADALAKVGHRALADEVSARRLAALAWVSDRPQLLELLRPAAAQGLADSPLGRRSVWALVLAEEGLGTGVSTGPEPDFPPEDLALLADEPAGGELAVEDPVFEPLVSTAPGWPVVARPARGTLEDLVRSPRADDEPGDGPPDLDPPEPDALVWVFEAGPALYVERALDRWFVRLKGVPPAMTEQVTLSGSVVRQGWDGRTLWALLEDGPLSVSLPGETVQVALVDPGSASDDGEGAP